LTLQDKDRPTFALLGGSFNPVHVGHVALATCLLEQGRADQVLVVPTHVNPFKQEETALPGTLRYEMLRRAMAPLPRTAVLDVELRRPPPSFTVETLHILRAQFPRTPAVPAEIGRAGCAASPP